MTTNILTKNLVKYNKIKAELNKIQKSSNNIKNILLGGFFMYNFRTDLAVERTNIYRKANKLEEIDGIETEDQEVSENIKVSRVKITN